MPDANPLRTEGQNKIALSLNHLAGSHAPLKLLLKFFPPQPHPQQRVAMLEGVLVGLGDDHLEWLVAPERRPRRFPIYLRQFIQHDDLLPADIAKRRHDL